MLVLVLAILLAFATPRAALASAVDRPWLPEFGGLVVAGAPPAPDVYAGITLELRDQGLDRDGRWYQAFRATIRSGGTISDVAIAVYNDIQRTDDVFKAAQRQNPDLKDPAFVYVGQTIDLTIDPTTVAVFKETKSERDGAERKHYYYNGIVETVFVNAKSGVQRTIDFPPDSRASTFTFLDEVDATTENIGAIPGTRLVDYRYVAGDAFGDVARQVFGVNSIKAANELIEQSGWDPNNWPPSDEGVTRFVVDTKASYVDERPRVLDYAPTDPAARDRWTRLSAEREAVGIYPVRMENDGIVYQVMVGSGSVGTKQVARMLYNDEGKAPEVAKSAGLALPAEGAEQAEKERDLLLIGRTFEIKVPFIQEYFPLAERVPGEEDALVTRLVNGTVIYEYDRDEDESGLLRLIRYPSGYKSMLARPSDVFLLFLDFVHFQMVNLASPDLPREQRDLMAREFQARMLWSWSRSMPRELSDVAEDLHLNVSKSDTTYEVLARQREEIPWQERLVYNLWFVYPAVLGAVIVVLGTVILFAISWRTRQVQQQRWRDRMRRRG